MNDLTLSEASDKARKLIAEGKEDAVTGFMKIGAGFALVSDFKLHKLENMTFKDYIVATGMSVAKGNQALSVYRKFGHLDTKGVLHSRLIELTSVRMDDAQKVEAVEQAKLLGPRDFERFVAEKKGKPLPENCTHENQVTICTVCRKKL